MARSAARSGAVSLQDTIRSAAAELPADTVARIAAAIAPALAQPAANQPEISPADLRFWSSVDGLAYMAQSHDETLQRCLSHFQHLLSSITSAAHEDSDSAWTEALCDIGAEWIYQERQRADDFRRIQQAAIALATGRKEVQA